MALPSFIRARQRAQNTKFINALRVASDAFDTYAMEHSSYPADVNRGIVPPGHELPISITVSILPRRRPSAASGIGTRISSVSRPVFRSSSPSHFSPQLVDIDDVMG